MRERDYNEIYQQLNSVADIQRLSRQHNLDQELLRVIYTNRNVRETKKKFHMVAKMAPKLHYRWKRGESIAQIAHSLRFSPVMTGLMIMQEHGVGRKQYRQMLNSPEKISDQKLRKQIESVIEHDFVYSPHGNDLQFERGKMGEANIAKWLQKHGIEYETEYDLKKRYVKTPDFLFSEPLPLAQQFRDPYPNNCYRWIESKANFGDRSQVRRDYEKQFRIYTQMFGPGLVVYHFGFINELDREYPDVHMVRPDFFR